MSIYIYVYTYTYSDFKKLSCGIICSGPNNFLFVSHQNRFSCVLFSSFVFFFVTKGNQEKCCSHFTFIYVYGCIYGYMINEDLYAKHQHGRHTHTNAKCVRKENIITGIAYCHIESLRLIRQNITTFRWLITHIQHTFTQFDKLISLTRSPTLVAISFIFIFDTPLRFGKHSSTNRHNILCK